jgi:anti-anti-sigma factor
VRKITEKVKFRKEGDIGLFRLLGDFDIEDREPLIVYFDDKLKEGIRKFIIDLSEATYIPSAVWGALITILKHARENNGDVCITGLNGQPAKVFQVMSFDKVFKTFPDINEALKNIR